MTFSITGETNYAAQVVRVHKFELPGLDNLRGIKVGGYTALISKDVPDGSLLAVFPAESQLSEGFASRNNLFRHSEKNADPAQTGYLEDNRRIRALKLRGHVSSALALSVDVFDTELSEGDVFDTVNGEVVSQKYYVKPPVTAQAKTQAKIWRRVEDKFLPEHIDTENYWRNAHKIPDDAFITVTQKLHGTSIRASRTYVKVKPRLRDKVARWFGVRTTDTELDVVFGSRKVIKDPNNPNQQHFYDKDLWTEFGLSIADQIPPGVVVYGELIGWASETSPIQTNYTYNVQQGYQKLYVYRVAVITPDAHLYDLPWNAVKQFAIERGWNYVPELWTGSHKDFDVDSWMDKTYYPTRPNAVPLSKDSPVDEGVVVRWDGGFTPTVLKAKSSIFFLHETKLLDKGEEGLS